MSEYRVFTQSELRLFRKCRRAWWLSVYRRLRLKPQYRKKSAASLGSLVHFALEQQDRGTITWQQALLGSEISEMYEFAEDAEKLKQSAQEHRMADAMLDGYFEWLAQTGVEQFLETVGIERKVTAPLPEKEGVALMGKLDRLVQHLEFDTLHFIDYKTVGDLKRLAQFAEVDEQFLHYTLLLRLKFPDHKVYSGIWRMLVKSMRTDRTLDAEGNEKEFFGEHEYAFTEQQLASYRTRIGGIIDDIRNVEVQLERGADPLSVVYPTPVADYTGCGRCEFQGICPMFDDGSRVEGLVEEWYEQGDPLDRYQHAEEITL